MKITFQSCPTSNIPCAECGHREQCLVFAGASQKYVKAVVASCEELRAQLRTADAALAAMTTERNEMARQLTIAEGKLAAIRAEIDSPEWLLRDTRICAILDGAGELNATRDDHDAAAQAVLDAIWRDGAGEG